MRNFSQAFLTFFVFAIIAQFIYQEKKSDDESPTKTKTSSVKQSTKSNSISQKDSIIRIKKDSLTKKTVEQKEEFNHNITEMVFQDKFVTSSKNTKVIFPRKFFYFKDSIFNFLNNNQSKELIITANYLENENDFGIKRANYLKSLLVKYGVNPKRIVTNTKQSNYQYDLEGFYADGITIRHQNMNPKKKEEIVNEITNKTLHSYFGNEYFKPDRTLYSYLLEVKNYLKQHPNKKIQIIGHTDNVGDEKANEWIGLQRAKNVSNYFIKQGIDSVKISAISKGESHPIDDNTTKQGRANNRRIEILIN